MAVILTNVLCIGLCVFITEEYEIYFWDAYGIFGFLYGASLAYFIKGIGLQSIKKVADSIVSKTIQKQNYKDPFP